MQLPISFLIKVYYIRANAIIVIKTEQIVNNTKNNISNSNNSLKIIQIRQLKQLGIRKLYQLLVTYFTNRNMVKAFFEKSIVKIKKKQLIQRYGKNLVLKKSDILIASNMGIKQ